MKKGFHTIMAAQFFSSLADNALFIAAVALLRNSNAADWQSAALVPMFSVFFVLLAPFVGAWADAWPKGRVMFASNWIKILGCLLMLTGVHPLLSYAIVGLGAAIYSPAKYGILTELLPATQLVKANAWMEGLTISSILLGVLLGGVLIGNNLTSFLQSQATALLSNPLDESQLPIGFAIACVVFLYLLAALFNIFIPNTGVTMQKIPRDLLRDFWRCNQLLWRDKLGQITLAVTTLFWGVSGNLRFVVLAWAGVVLAYSTSQASQLLGVVAIGTAVGAVWAASRVRLDAATRVIPWGMVIGGLVVLMNALDWVPREWQWMAVGLSAREGLAYIALFTMGISGGYLVVPMNALLQHRGHNLMGAGRSIAVQNFNEQACILILGLFYTALTGTGINPIIAIVSLGLLVVVTMFFLQRWHAYNVRHHGPEIESLLQLSRQSH